MNPGTLVIRADASVAMGTGHVMRCLALAQAWRDSGGDVVIAAAELTPAIAHRLQSEGIEMVRLESKSTSTANAHQLAALADARCASWVVVDGYQFDSAYQRSIKDSGFRLLLIDDTGQCGPYCADVVLNQNAYAGEQMYFDRSPSTKLLPGLRYALLRKEFSDWREWRRNFAPMVQRLLIMMGGSDPENCTARILRAVLTLELKDVEITVVIGGSNPHHLSLRELESHARNIRLQIDVNNMPEVMAGADLAISAAGTTCYELALLQVPMVLLAVAENQVPSARVLQSLGAAIAAGWCANFNEERFADILHQVIQDSQLRRSLAQSASRLLDGMGARRVCQCLLDIAERSEARSRLRVGVC